VIAYLFSHLIPTYPSIEFGAHLHTTPSTAEEKINAAYAAGCLRFDGAIRGFGGCPMAKDELTGNMPTEQLINYFEQQDIVLKLNQKAFDKAYQQSTNVFS